MPQRVGPAVAAGKPRGAFRSKEFSDRSSFSNALATAQARERPLSFSAHAVQRMRAHGIVMDAESRRQIESALQLARTKGIRESLVVTGKVNWIISVPNSAVITAVPRGANQGDVFSQIDGAVIMD